MIVLFNKPYGVLSQFTPEGAHRTLKDFIDIPGVYPAGRLDADSEGLLLLTDNGALQHQISHPKRKLWKTYLAQVEGIPDAAAISQLARGVELGDFRTLPARAQIVAEPDKLWERNPPVRYRKSIPTSWLQLSICEGKNRQVRRMTAKAGFPTLRLIRLAIGPWTLDGIKQGEYRIVADDSISANPLKS